MKSVFIFLIAMLFVIASCEKNVANSDTIQTQTQDYLVQYHFKSWTKTDTKIDITFNTKVNNIEYAVVILFHDNYYSGIYVSSVQGSLLTINDDNPDEVTNIIILAKVVYTK